MSEFKCDRCGYHKWVGWAAAPGFPRKAQCVHCGLVNALPSPTLMGKEADDE